MFVGTYDEDASNPLNLTHDNANDQVSTYSFTDSKIRI